MTLQSSDFKTTAQYRATVNEYTEEITLLWTGEDISDGGEFWE